MCTLVIGKVSHVGKFLFDRVSAVEGANSSSVAMESSSVGIENSLGKKAMTTLSETRQPSRIKRGPAVMPTVKKLRRAPVPKRSRP